jgi:glycine hydroxymethyltransferase
MKSEHTTIKTAEADIPELKGIVDELRETARRHNRYHAESLPMIASENILSPRALEMLTTDLHGRYAEGQPGKRYYQGCKYYDEIEIRATDLARRLFQCRWANVQSTSGTVSNMAVFKALAKPGDAITAVSTADGGHISHAKFGSAGLRGLKIHEYPFDQDTMTVESEGAARLIRETKPQIVLLGQSVFLFPTPIKGEIKDAATEVGATIVYDAAHVLGLIAGGEFQDPLREGAHVITGSTHKTLPGPQGGVVLSDLDPEDEDDAKILRKLESGVFPGVVSSYHLHHVAAKSIAFAEHLAFGRDYAQQIVKNAKALAAALAKLGFKVFAEDHGYTQSHQVLVQIGGIGEGKGRWAAEELEKAGIISNMNMIPGDTKPLKPSGIRLGVQELTRIGMGERQMDTVAGFLERVILKGDTKNVRQEVADMREHFQAVRYCFNDEQIGGYDFHPIVPE